MIMLQLEVKGLTIKIEPVHCSLALCSPTELNHYPNAIKFHLITAVCVRYCYSHFTDEEIWALGCSGPQ